MSRKRQKRTLILMGGDSPTKKLHNLLTSKLHHINLLHGDKSTYFYKGKLRFLMLIPACGLLGIVSILTNPAVSNVERAGAVTKVPAEDFSIKLTLSGTVQSTENLDAGVVGYISNIFTVTTKSTASYSLFLQPASGYTNALKGKTNTSTTIPGVGSNVSVANFGKNTWGYGMSETNETDTSNSALQYSTIPSGSTAIKTVSNPDDGDDSYKLVFAAKIGDEKPADHYQSQVMLSVAASPVEITLFGEISTMQEMTTSICDAASVNDSGRLKDTRDGKYYWVAKLADGNCWMTQNLDLDIPSAGLSSSNTDITTDWDSSSTYKPVATQTGATPTDFTEKGTSGYDNVASWDPAASHTNKQEYYCSNNTTTKCNLTASANGGHDAQGNYYSWVAATAGTGGGFSSTQDAPGSICPKNWRLPPSSGSKSFAALGDAYGITSSSTQAKLADAPLYLVRAGDTYSAFSAAGERGRYWLSTANNSYRAAHVAWNASDISYATVYIRTYGYSVRCVAR